MNSARRSELSQWRPLLCLLAAALTHGLVLYAAPGPALSPGEPKESRLAIRIKAIPATLESSPRHTPEAVEAERSLSVENSHSVPVEKSEKAAPARRAASPAPKKPRQSTPHPPAPAPQAASRASRPQAGSAPPAKERLAAPPANTGDEPKQPVHSQAAANAGGESSPPQILPEWRKSPVYPPLARKRGQEGKVILLAAIAEDGRLNSLKIAQGSGHALLDEAALKAVRKWRFRPASRNGKNEADALLIPVLFRLQDAR